MKRRILFLFLMFLMMTACAQQSVGIPVEDAHVAVESTPTRVEAVPVVTDTQTPARIPDASPTPEPTRDLNHSRTIVEDFYAWYLAQPTVEVLVGRSYQNSPYLSGIFQSDVGYLLDAMEQKGPGADPFTCAQNSLPSLTFDPVFVSGSEAYALARVLIEGETRHFFVVQLGQGEGSWKIDAVQCADNPKSTAMAFATWYLGYAYHDQDARAVSADPHNPIQAETYRESFLLTPRLIEEISQRKQTEGGADPILQSQVLPVGFTVQDGPVKNSAVLRMEFGPQSTRYYNLYMVSDPMFSWKIDRIEPVEVPVFDPQANPDVDVSEWNGYSDPDHRFSFRYPTGWNAQTVNLSANSPGDPVQQAVHFFGSGFNPDIPVLWMHIFEGSESQLLQYYITESHQRVVINEQAVWVDRETCSTRYVFRHPSNADIWIIFGDACPTLEGREEYARELAETLAPLLRSVAFP